MAADFFFGVAFRLAALGFSALGSFFFGAGFFLGSSSSDLSSASYSFSLDEFHD
jgi:hypothetical protein